MRNTKSRQGCGEKGTLAQYWWGCQLVRWLWERALLFLKKLKQNYHMTQQPQFWVYIPRERKVTLKRLLHPHVHCSIIQNSQDTKTEVSLDKWKDFLKCGIHTQWTIIQPLKRRNSCLWQQHGWTFRVKWNESEKSQHCMPPSRRISKIRRVLVVKSQIQMSS